MSAFGRNQQHLLSYLFPLSFYLYKLNHNNRFLDRPNYRCLIIFGQERQFKSKNIILS
jgi:hypothetical protein